MHASAAADELAVPEEAMLAAREAARAGLRDHSGLTNGTGTEAAASSKAPTPARRRRSIFGRSARSGAREGPGFLPATGLTNGGSLVNGSGRVNGGRVNGGRVNGSGRVNGGRVNGSRVNGGRVNGGRVNGGRINGGRVNGSRVNGGRVNGGRINGGLVNGGALLYSQQVRERRRRSTRRTALLLAVLMFGVTFLAPFVFNGFFGAAPITIDGDFSDWAGVPIVPDSPIDEIANPDTNLVAFSALQSDRDLFFYFQVAQPGRPFSAGGSPPLAESFRLLIDRDRNQSTGYRAFGLGVDYIVELTGYGGALRQSSLRVFPAGSGDPTSADSFATAGTVRAIARGNEVEGGVPLLSLGLGPTSALPYLLLLSQDSAGHEDVGDAVFSSRPGVLALSQTVTSLGALPTDRDSLLVTVEGRALHQNITLDALVLSVDGEGGGGLSLSFATIAGQNRTLNATALAGADVRLDLTAGGAPTFNPASPPMTIAIYGRAVGTPGVAAVRLAVNGSQFAVTGPPPAGTSGHASLLPPMSFERAYAGVAPSSIRIDGAFADWGPLGPFDADPDDDVVSGTSGSTPNASNAAAPVNQNIDIRETRADVNSGSAQVSFLVSVDGSILSGRLLDFPAYVPPTQVSGGSGGGGAPPPAPPATDTATVYIDTDSNPLTGWNALPGIGVDAILQVHGRGGGYGRVARVTETSLAHWDAALQRFNTTLRPLPVGLGSSKLETQVAAADLCGGPCARVRYAFFMQDFSAGLDSTNSFSGNFRGDGEALLFDEGPSATRNAYQGDLNVPVLSFSVASPASNQATATLRSFLARLDGVAPSDTPRLSIFADPNSTGRLDAGELAAGPLAVGTLDASGFASLPVSANLTLPPGTRLDALLCLDIARNATTPAWVNASIARPGGLQSLGVVDVRYSFPLSPSPVRILPFTSGARGQNNLTINELNFVTGWIEVYDTTGSSTNLTSPAQMGIEIYRTKPNGGQKTQVAIIDLSGSTNSGGFAVVNTTLGYSPATQVFHVALWCSNCTAGQGPGNKNNRTYLDDVIIPQNTTVGAWGRFPDGNGSFVNTTNNTRGAVNKIPEFSSALVPAGGALFVVATVRRARSRAGVGPP